MTPFLNQLMKVNRDIDMNHFEQSMNIISMIIRSRKKSQKSALTSTTKLDDLPSALIGHIG